MSEVGRDCVRWLPAVTAREGKVKVRCRASKREGERAECTVRHCML